MFLVTSEQMRAIDRYTMDTIGIPEAVLMENAGRAVADEVVNFLGKNARHSNKPWIILTGKGNNGGDGIVAARHLVELGVRAELLYAVDPGKLQGEAAKQRGIAVRLGIPSSCYSPGHVPWQNYSGIIDGLLGTGSYGIPREPYAALIKEANGSGLPIVAIDTPSGLNADTGEVCDSCIRANITVALAFRKIGLTQYPGADFAGDVKVRAIGIPASLATQFQAKTMLSGPDTFLNRFNMKLPLERPNDSHKGTFGHALIAAGSRKYSGAGWLSAKSALRAGAGLATWSVPETLLPAMIGLLPEAVLAGVADDGQGNWAFNSADDILKLADGKEVLAVGPGLSRFDGDCDWLRRIWTEAQCPLIVDADALNILADADGLAGWPKRSSPVVLTPHPGEMARLAKISTREVQRDRIGLARRFAEKHGVILVLKGARTVIAVPTGEVYVNPTGNSGMATGGSGDVLTGVIAGLAAQHVSLEAAAVLGVYMHGEAGDRAATSRPSSASLISGDIIESL